jgi:large subunit ribosomal protein L23
MQQILIKPLITEKMTTDQERNNAYGFVVALGANKIEIKKAIEAEYGVTVTSVRSVRVDGKARQRYTKTGMVKGRTNQYKKAIVSIGEGEMIDFYENI